MVAISNEVEQVQGSIDVGGDRRSQVRIEIRQPRAVHYHIKIARQAFQSIGVEPKSGPGDVSLHNFDSIPQEPGKILAVSFVKGFEDGRLFYNSLKPALGGR